MPQQTHARSRGHTSNTQFRIMVLGDSALTIEFGNAIDPEINARVLVFSKSVVEQDWPGIHDIVPTYRSITIHFDPLRWDSAALTKQLKGLPWPKPGQAASQGTLHEIPVLYGGEWGPDLHNVAAFAGLRLADVIALHTSIPYRVYMLGFSPGFPYLGLVPEQLAIPRHATPRMQVPAGSVGIADRQTGIYPTTTPGGWQLIGRTPTAIYRKNQVDPFLLKPGDLVQFRSIGCAEFDQLNQDAQYGNH